MDMPATLWKHPASSPLTTEARQPTTSVGSISPPCVLHIHRTAKHFSIEGGCDRKRKCCIPCISPPVLCTNAKVAKGGEGVFTGHYSTCNYIIDVALTVTTWASLTSEMIHHHGASLSKQQTDLLIHYFAHS